MGWDTERPRLKSICLCPDVNSECSAASPDQSKQASCPACKRCTSLTWACMVQPLELRYSHIELAESLRGCPALLQLLSWLCILCCASCHLPAIGLSGTLPCLAWKGQPMWGCPYDTCPYVPITPPMSFVSFTASRSSQRARCSKEACNLESILACVCICSRYHIECSGRQVQLQVRVAGAESQAKLCPA